MAKGNGQSDRVSPLTTAAAALDAELRRYTELAALAVKTPLTSEKSLERATKAIVEAAESEKRVLEHVQQLVQAISGAREAQQTSATALNAHVEAVNQKRAELDSLLTRFAKLGEVAKTLNAAMQKIAGYKANPYSPEEATEVTEALAAMETGMGTCAEHAQELASEATSRDFEELARQAESLRQQILSAKNRLSLLRTGLSAAKAQSPS